MELKLEEDLDEIKADIKHIKHRLVEKVPDHFSPVDAINAFFGALFLGLTFVFKGLLLDVGLHLTWSNIIVIITSTLFFLTMQIYFIGYKRVQDKEERPFGQFLMKRLLTIYIIALSVSFYLLFLFGYYTLVGSLGNLLKLTIIISFPCSIGASVGDLLRKY
jgi:uncharacterized membrane protein